MDYSFNGEVARLYGVEEAVFLHNLYWWIAKNEANGRHYHDGRSWTYNSMEAFGRLFPFWSKRQIQRIIKNLKEQGAIHIGNYNQKGFDRTQWYALDESVTRLYQTENQNGTMLYPNGHMDVTEPSHGCNQTVTPIPDSKPYSKQIYSAKEMEELFDRLWELYPNKRGKGRVSEAKKRELACIGFEEMKRCVERYLDGLREEEWRKPQNGSTFFNSGYVDYLDRNYSQPAGTGSRWGELE